MTGRVGKRPAMASRRWQSAVMGGCAGALLLAVGPVTAADVPAASGDAPAAPAVAPADDSDNREVMLRLLAEEMTKRLVTALSNQARSHSAEVTAFEQRLAVAEHRFAQAEAARQQADAAHRDEMKGMRDLLDQAKGAMGELEASHSAMKAALAERDQDVAQLKASLDHALAEVAEARGQLAQTREARAQPDAAAAAELEDLRKRSAETARALEAARQEAADAAAERDRLREQAQDTTIKLAGLKIDRDLIEGEREALADRLEAVAEQATAAPEPQPSAPALPAEAAQRLGRIEQFLSSTGIDVRKLAAPVLAKGAIVPPPLPLSRGGRGGPFIPLSAIGLAEPAKDREVALRVHPEYMERLDRVERVLRVMPLGAPLQNYGFESPFGPRSDPFRKKAAVHDGVDLSAPMGTPLHVTAPGTVVFAGRKSAYGRAVDVKHAGGLVTRYAHMSAIKVDEGDRLARGDVVGLLGSSGRSTGPHVHYEIILDGTPIDPARFMGRRK